MIASSIFSTLYIKITFLANTDKLVYHQWLHLHLVMLTCTLMQKKVQDLNCDCESIFRTLYMKITFLTNSEYLVYHQWLCSHLVTLTCTFMQKNLKNCDVVDLIFLAPGTIESLFHPTMTIQLSVNGCFYIYFFLHAFLCEKNPRITLCMQVHFQHLVQ